MEKSNAHTLKPLLSLLVITRIFLTWGLAQWIGETTGNGQLTAVLFSFLFCFVAGTFIPLFIKQRNNLPYQSGKTNYIWGSIVIIFILGVGLVLSGAAKQAIAVKYDFLMLIKYKLLFLPMALALSLVSFVILPHTIANWQEKLSRKIVLVLAIGLYFFVGFWIDQLFSNIELPLTMGFLGILFGIAYLFVRNFWVMSLVVYIIFLGNTLAENKYNDYPFWVAIVCSVLCISLLLTTFKLRNNNTNGSK